MGGWGVGGYSVIFSLSLIFVNSLKSTHSVFWSHLSPILLSCHSTLCPFFVFIPIKYSLCCPDTPQCVAFTGEWSTRKENWLSLFPLPTAVSFPQLLNLGSYACCHNYCELICTTALPCPENSFLIISTVWLLDSSIIISEPQRRGGGIDVPFQTEHFTIPYSLHLNSCEFQG